MTFEIERSNKSMFSFTGDPRRWPQGLYEDGNGEYRVLVVQDGALLFANEQIEAVTSLGGQYRPVTDAKIIIRV